MSYASIATILHDPRRGTDALEFAISTARMWDAHLQVLCAGVDSAWPMSVHVARSVDRWIGTPGSHVKVEVAMKYSSPTRHHDGSGWNPGRIGFVMP